MRENSGLWIALIVAGGLLLAGLAGVGAMLAMKTRTVQQRAKVEDPKPAEVEKAPPEKKDAPKAEPPAAMTAAEKWAGADLREYANKIQKDYEGNAVAADNKYKDRTIGVVGEVQKVDTLKGKPVVILKAGAGEFGITTGYVFCVCGNADRDKLAVLADGHWIALVGRCTGKGALGGLDIGGSMVMVQDCDVVHVARTEAEMKQSFQKK